MNKLPFYGVPVDMNGMRGKSHRHRKLCANGTGVRDKHLLKLGEAGDPTAAMWAEVG